MGLSHKNTGSEWLCEYPREKLIPILPRLLCRVAMQHRSRYFTCILVAYVTHKSSLQLIRVTTAAEKFTAMRMLWRHVPIFGNPRYFRSNCCLCLSAVKCTMLLFCISSTNFSHSLRLTLFSWHELAPWKLTPNLQSQILHIFVVQSGLLFLHSNSNDAKVFMRLPCWTFRTLAFQDYGKSS